MGRKQVADGVGDPHLVRVFVHVKGLDDLGHRGAIGAEVHRHGHVPGPGVARPPLPHGLGIEHIGGIPRADQRGDPRQFVLLFRRNRAGNLLRHQDLQPLGRPFRQGLAIGQFRGPVAQREVRPDGGERPGQARRGLQQRQGLLAFDRFGIVVDVEPHLADAAQFVADFHGRFVWGLLAGVADRDRLRRISGLVFRGPMLRQILVYPQGMDLRTAASAPACEERERQHEHGHDHERGDKILGVHETSPGGGGAVVIPGATGPPPVGASNAGKTDSLS